MLDKKNQHFIPRFYLKKFSLYSQNKRLGIFNLPLLKFIESGTLYNQSAKDYFYGRDLKTENAFEKLETEVAKIINLILEENALPVTHSREHQMLLMFVLTLLGRTVYAAQTVEESINKYKKIMLSIDDNALPESEKYIDFTLTNAVRLSLENCVLSFPLVRDLKLKLIINETEQPFFTSDHPVILYNQFLENRKKYGSNIGLASKGLQIFLPLSPKFILILFDKDIYKVGDKKKDYIELMMPSDIQSLNLLQCINANKNIYFNEKISEKQIRELMRIANPYRRRTKSNLDQYPNEIKMNTENIILHLYNSDVKCSLSLSFISLLKKAKSYIVGNKVTQVRNEKLCLLHEKFIELVNKGLYNSLDFDQFINDSKNAKVRF